MCADACVDYEKISFQALESQPITVSFFEI